MFFREEVSFQKRVVDQCLENRGEETCLREVEEGAETCWCMTWVRIYCESISVSSAYSPLQLVLVTFGMNGTGFHPFQ